MRKWWTELSLISVVVFWGINYTVNKYGLTQLSPEAFIAVRFTATAPILLAVTYLVERSILIRKGDLFRLTLISLIGISFYQTLFTTSLKYTTATNSSLLIALSPIFTTLFAILFKQDKMNWRMQIGSVVSLVGAVIVLTSGRHVNQHYPHSLLGDLIALIASVFWGLYPVLTTPLLKRYSALRITAWSALIGATPLLILSSLTFSKWTWHLKGLTWFSLLYSVIIVTAYGLVTWYRGVEKVGSARVMIYMYLVPVVSVVFADLFNHEHFYLSQFIGGILILAGISYVKGLHLMFRVPNRMRLPAAKQHKDC